MNQFIKIEIKVSSIEEADILIAGLSEINFYAFVHEDSFGEQEENTLAAYIKEEDFDEEKLKEIAPFTVSFGKTIIKEENWNQQWESDFQPVIVNDFAAIRASFHEPLKNVKHDLIITPKMSFGTGHHATTFLMAALMEKINFQNKTVLDFGTGTGVLAILAEKLGASKVIAIDNDEWSINNTIENIEVNKCKNIFVEKRSDILDIEPVDVVLANINLNVLISAASALSTILKPEALLLIAGFLSKDENTMVKSFGELRFVKKDLLKKEDWLAILFQKALKTL